MIKEVAMKIKVGVVGCGSWGRNHARVYKELPGAELVCVADLNPAVARNMKLSPVFMRLSRIADFGRRKALGLPMLPLV